MDSALIYMHKCIGVLEKVKRNSNSLMLRYLDLSKLYSSDKQSELAKEYIQIAKSIKSKSDYHKVLLAETEALYYKSIGEYKVADSLFIRAHALADEYLSLIHI